MNLSKAAMLLGRSEHVGQRSLEFPSRKKLRPRHADRQAYDSLENRHLLAGGIGLHAQYFNNSDLTNLATQRLDASIDFDWSSESPDAAVDPGSFSARWSGQIEAPYSEDFELTVRADDGARLWINGQLLIDRFESAIPLDESASIRLIAGRRYDLQMEYRATTGNSSVTLEWNSESLDQQVVPTDRLFPTARGGASVERFDNVTGDDVVDLTANANFPDSPSTVTPLDRLATSGNADNNFGDRILGYVHAPVSGPYRFFMAADAAAELWLSNSAEADQKQQVAQVTSAVAVEDWQATAGQQSDPIYLVAGQKYYFEALHKESSGVEHLSVAWRLPGQTDIRVIEGEHLSPALPIVRLFAETPSTGEGDLDPGRLRVVRSDSPLNNPLTVNYLVSGSATNGVDYGLLSGTITISAGSESALLNIAALTDGLTEGSESVIVELLASNDYEVGLTSERTSTTTLQDDVALPVGGNSLFNSNSLAAFTYFGGTFSSETVSGFSNVIQASITATQPFSYNAQLQHAIDFPVAANDLLVAEFNVRSMNGAGEVNVVFELDGAPYTQSVAQGIETNSAWQKVQIPFSPVEDYGSGQAKLNFQVGQQVQTLQFADVKLLNYGPSRDMLGPSEFFTNNIGGSFGTTGIVTASHPDFTSAHELQTIALPDETYRYQIAALSEAAIASGQTMRVDYWARAVAGSNPRLESLVLRTDTYASLGYQLNSLTNAWQQYSLNATVGEDFASQGLQINFQAGFDPQTVQIGGVSWTNLNQPYAAEDLPTRSPVISYGGRSGVDAWRQDADDRIAAERADSLTVRVFDANGVPLEGATVNVRQQQHQFLFGSAVNGFEGRLEPNGNLKYQSEIKRLFNTVTDEYALQWIPLLQDQQRGFNVANFAGDNDLYMRGHSGIWPSRSTMPDSVWNQYDNLLATQGTTVAANYLRQATTDRITHIATSFASVTDEWDVVNEPRVNNLVMQILGDDVVADWFAQFRSLDPSARLSLNEYDIFTNNGNNGGNLANFQDWLDLLAADGLVDVIGEQSHFTETNLTDIPQLGTLINNLHTQNSLPINISELDVESKDLQLQADYLRDYLTMAFSQTGIEKIVQWGFWEGRHWRPDAALYRTDFSIKPNGQAYEDLVFGRWWTDAYGTAQDGSMTTQAFLGDYEISVQYDGQTFSYDYAHRGIEGQEANFTLPVTAVDTNPPALIAATRDGQPTESIGLLGRPDQIAELQFVFDRDVVISLDALTLTNQTTGDVPVDLSGIAFSYDASTRTATWTLTDLESPLEPAFYSATLAADQIIGVDANKSLDGDNDGNEGADFVAIAYVAIPGDANLDGKVDILGDASALVENLGLQSGAIWSQGDFNASQTVDILGDGSILVSKLGRSVIPSATATLNLATFGFVEHDENEWSPANVQPINPLVAKREGEGNVNPAPFVSTDETLPYKRLLQARRSFVASEPATLSLAGSLDLDKAFELIDLL